MAIPHPTPMQIELRFFAGLRETLGTASERCHVPAEISTIAALRRWLAARSPVWETALGPSARLRVAVNQRLVREDVELRDGAEVAFFPPVTGG